MPPHIPKYFAFLLALALSLALPRLTFSQTELLVSGYVTNEGLASIQDIPSGKASITIWNSDKVFSNPKVSGAGAFYFKLPVGQKYYLEASQPRYTTKIIEFDLAEVDEKKLLRKGNNFELTVSLLEGTYLLPEILEDTNHMSVFWDFDLNQINYSVRSLTKQWARIDSLRTQYSKALVDGPSMRMTDHMTAFSREVSWPSSLEDTIDVGVYQDYLTYVNLINQKIQNPEFNKTRILYLDNPTELAKMAGQGLEVLFVPVSSNINGNALLGMLGPNALLITNGYGFHETMINFQNIGSKTLFEINEIEMAKRGFGISDGMKLMATITSDKNEWQQVVNSAQESLREEKGKVAQLTESQKQLEKRNEQLLRAQDSLDLLLAKKNAEVANLQNAIYDSRKELKNLSQEVAQSFAALDNAKAEILVKQDAFQDLETDFAIKENQLGLLNVDLEKTYQAIVDAENKLEATNKELTGVKRINMWIALALGFITISLILAVWGYFNQRTLTKLIKSKSEEVKKQKHLLQQRNIEVQDSISYAKRIQDAMLPSVSLLSNYFDQAFVYYEPKDVVAGDFFWIKDTPKKLYFAVADCTGHGVPGAMMSVICHNALNRALRDLGQVDPAQILDLTRIYVIDQIAQGEENVMDGMDIALCSFDKDSRVLEFAGAQSPLWILTKREIEEAELHKNEVQISNMLIYEIKGDKQPVGQFTGALPFVNHKIQLQEGDVIYVFSDGFADQFGGKRGKKLKYSLFKEILALAQDQDQLDRQKEFISEYFVNWKGDLEQVDDVCVMGLKV